MAGTIGTGKYSFDAPERRKDDGSGFGPISCTWPRKPLQIISSPGCRPNQCTNPAQIGGLIATISGLNLFGVSDGGAPFTCVGGL